jgi:hypothetical protein
MSLVNQVPPAASACAGDHFASQLAFYTDPYSVHTDLLAGTTAVAPIDLRDVDEYARGHLPGAMRIDYASISSLPADVIPDGDRSDVLLRPWLPARPRRRPEIPQPGHPSEGHGWGVRSLETVPLPP